MKTAFILKTTARASIVACLICLINRVEPLHVAIMNLFARTFTDRSLLTLLGMGYIINSEISYILNLNGIKHFKLLKCLREIIYS